ncbi:MAG TPA: diguanylate cyclase [Actinomycetota bacterium]|nr:diguanylate cyclase [Actinomycetota bacterium]
MSLQTRLFAFFIAIVVLPLGVASVFGQRIIIREVENRSFNELRPAQDAAVAVFREKTSSASDRVNLIAADPNFSELLRSGAYGELKTFLLTRLQAEDSKIDFIVIGDAAGNILLDAMTQSEFLAGVPPLTPAEAFQEDAALPADRRFLMIRSRVTIRNPLPPNDVGWQVIGGNYLDSDFVSQLSRQSGFQTTLLINEEAIASTIEVGGAKQFKIDVDPAEEGRLETTVGGQTLYAAISQIDKGIPVKKAALVVSRSNENVLSTQETLRTTGIVLLVAAVVLAVVLGFLLAGVLSRPLREVAEGANAISAGRYDHMIRVRGRDEIGQVAASFNAMTARLSAHITQLEDSKEELKEAFTRFGEILRSTHDRDRMLEMVLDNSMATLGATRGALMLTSGRHLEVSMVRNIEGGDFDLDVAKGVAGYVAEAGESLRFPMEDDPEFTNSANPDYRTVISVPLYSYEKVIGVLNLYDKEKEEMFTAEDLSTMSSLADHAGVAIENVLLHEEAQRLAVVDPLVGVWNRRYFVRALEQEIDRSKRSGRPFCLLVFDIDDFKSFNDTYGHQTGDSVLIELAARVQNVIRNVDVFARYGGEEFVLLLIETDLAGGLKTGEKVRSTIADGPFRVSTVEQPLPVTVSIGVAVFDEHGAESKMLIDAADIAMYAAKAEGKNRVVVYRPEEGM